MDQESRAYFERRAKEESLKAKGSLKSDAACAHRELEKLYRAKLADGADELRIVAEE